MTDTVFDYLGRLLATQPILHPSCRPFPFKAEFEATFRNCHLTVMQVALEAGHEPVLGIEFLDLHGKLYPWPHMVNRWPEGLVDHSPTPDQPKLGFIETGWPQFRQWREVTAAYNALAASAKASRFNHREADALSREFLGALRVTSRVGAAR